MATNTETRLIPLIYPNVETAGKAIFGDNYGCQIVEWKYGERFKKVEPRAVLAEAYPEGFEIETNVGFYWLWERKVDAL